MSPHNKHQQIASTLFRCVRGISLCDCQKPCEQAKKEFEDSFAHTRPQTPLGEEDAS